jgi:small-conductance mechanosensitive channel
VAILALPTLSNRAWHAAPAPGSSPGMEPGHPRMIWGTWWSITRLLLSVLVLSAIPFALLGYATLAAHLHNAIFSTALMITIVVLAHRLMADLLEEAAAPDTPPGRWVRHRLGLAPDSALRGQHLLMLVFDLFLVLLLAVGIPAAWSVDTDAIVDGAGQLMRGVKVGGVTISLGNVGMAIVAFVVCMAIARLVRTVVRDRVLPTVDAPMPLRQSIDAGLNYVGVLLALVIGIGVLGVDFTNLAIVLGALSVGIGLGLQNIANNVISGVILLVERPIKAGDWVNVAGHEGFVRRINIRATEMETFQRTHVIMPNSMFLQNPVVNRTYADTSSRVEIKLTVGLATDVPAMEALLRETALGHPRVLRVPAPIVRFERITPSGLDFELFVFVSRLEDRLLVTNDLNQAILAKMIEAGILDPKPIPTFKLHGVEKPLSVDVIAKKDGDAAAPP